VISKTSISFTCYGNLSEIPTIVTLFDGSTFVTKSISQAIPEQHASTIWRKGDLFRDFENFSFLHLELLRTREKRVPVQSGVVGVNQAKVVSVTVGVWELMPTN
jgi:hypothetical protein